MNFSTTVPETLAQTPTPKS